MTRLAAVVLAAGKGTRLKTALPKVLHPIGGLPMVLHALRTAQRAGASERVVVVGHGAEQVEAVVRSFDPDARFARQIEQKGTGHAAATGLAALTQGPERVLILSGDCPLLRPESLHALRAATGDRPVGFLSTELEDPTGYGRVVRDEQRRPIRVVEHKDASSDELRIREVNAGIYDVDLAFLRDTTAQLQSDNAQGELYLTEVVERAAGEAQAFCLADPSEAMGANTRAELAALQEEAWDRAAGRWMTEGTTILGRCHIDEEVQLGQDVTLHPGVHLRGRTRVGDGCVVDVGSVLSDSELAEGVVVHPYSILEQAKVGPGAQIGPFARLRPAADLGPGTKVGNFVEVKKSRLGPGAKINHLSYVGDAEVGAEVNVGAGTITCNYDGFAKHLTRIGDGTFVGSNSTLVAPVELGPGTYVAAGSTVTENSARDDLVFGRARQEVKPGRAKAVREAARRGKI
ncbi:MAG: bifunctional UDP-N-acetylglucosamine diphosphorylase/glucosamine-1-phosphate N-acetyltransferase GlmU [Myxococcota bacterium]